MVTAEAWVAALVRIQSLAWELPHAMVMAKNKKKKAKYFPHAIYYFKSNYCLFFIF